MSIRQQEFAERLSTREEETLRVVLGAADMPVREGDSTETMGRRIASAIWWRTHTPVGKIVMADDLAGIVDALASPEAAFTTGSTIVADGGTWMAP